MTNLTMANIGWNDDKHFLAEANHTVYGKVIMVSEASDGRINVVIINPVADIKRSTCTFSDRLTPTGRHYTTANKE